MARPLMKRGRTRTALARANQALRASEARLRGLIERLPEIVWSSDDTGAIVFISPNAVDVTGFADEEIVAAGVSGWFERIHPDDRPAVDAAYQGFLREGGRAFELHYRWQHRDGRWIWLRSRSSARYVVDGRVRCDGLIRDVTQERQMEERLHQALKMEGIGQLAGGVAHDFNNLLSVILVDTSILASELAAGDPRREEVSEIKAAAERAATLTRQLLAFSRQEIHRPEILAVNGVVRDLGKMLTRLIGEDVSLDLALDPETGAVEIDRGHLEQILLNLVVNARDAMSRGGNLTIETRNVELGADWPNAATGRVPPGSYVLLAVSDTGEGIPPEIQPRIFEPFFTTKGVGHGTGLGLATVYGIVTQAHGAISLYSEPGVGTTFKVYLPLRAGLPAHDAPAAAVEDLGGHGTILLVEDDGLVRSVCSRILRAVGHTVLEARNGHEAVRLIEREGGEAVDLVVTDVVMPVMSGPELVGELRRLLPEVEVLFISGYTDHGALRASLIQDTTHFLSKPFTPEVLARKVRSLLGDRRRLEA